MMAELSIADVLRHYGANRVPEGTGWKTMKCPFHGDSHASGRVNVDLGAYKCHGCPVSGDSLKIIRTMEEIGRDEAVEFAGKVLGKGVSNVSRTNDKQVKRRPLGREKWKGILD